MVGITKVKEKNFISIIVYLRNNADDIQSFLRRVDEIFSENFDKYEFVLVDDSSSDATVDKAAEIASELTGSITMVNLSWKHGIELAMVAGIDLSIGDFVFEFDRAELDCDVSVIMELYRKCINGIDIVSASPEKMTKPSSKLFYKILKKLSNKKMALMTETIRILSRRAINRIRLTKIKIIYRKALYHYSGLTIETIKYKSNRKSMCTSSLSFSEKVALASDILISYSNIGSKLAMLLSLLFFLFALSIISYTIIVYLYLGAGHIQEGWTTIMILLSISFAGLFIILAVISKYLSAILLEIQNKPLYVFKKIDKL